MSFSKSLAEASLVFKSIESDQALHVAIEAVVQRCCQCMMGNHKILLAGNGGSAAEAQHTAGELVGRFGYNRRGLPAIALTTDSTILTAIANDFGYESVFSRQIEALGMPGDILFAYSTSGRSPNIIQAMHAAKKKQIAIVAFTGQDPSDMAAFADYILAIPSVSTPRVQEGHLLLDHLICEQIELRCCPKEKRDTDQTVSN